MKSKFGELRKFFPSYLQEKREGEGNQTYDIKNAKLLFSLFFFFKL